MTESDVLEPVASDERTRAHPTPRRGKQPAVRASGDGRLAADVEEIQEIEINPLSVFSAGAGALALDVRLRAG